jgi:hypothetical protein
MSRLGCKYNRIARMVVAQGGKAEGEDAPPTLLRPIRSSREAARAQFEEFVAATGAAPTDQELVAEGVCGNVL